MATVPITSGDPSTQGAAPPVLGPPPTQVPPNMQLGRNPMLPQHPLGAYTDAQYEAQNATLRNNIAKQYADLLQQLGYTDENGNFVQGSVEAEANKQRGDLRRSADLAAEDVTHQHLLNSTLFSGLRGTDQARAEHPYVQGLADLETQTPLTLAKLYEKAGGLISDYTLQDNQFIADAAARRAAALQVPGGGGDGTGGTGDATPPVPPTPGSNIGPGSAGIGDTPPNIGAAAGMFTPTAPDPRVGAAAPFAPPPPAGAPNVGAAIGGFNDTGGAAPALPPLPPQNIGAAAGGFAAPALHPANIGAAAGLVPVPPLPVMMPNPYPAFGTTPYRPATTHQLNQALFT